MKYEERLRTVVSTYYSREKNNRSVRGMKRKLIIDGNAVYEIDEDCMLKRKITEEEVQEERSRQCKEGQKSPLKDEK